MSKKEVNLPVTHICASRIDGEVVPKLVMGACDEVYCGREVVLFCHKSGLFGTKGTGRDRVRKLTLHKGLINQCSLEDKPTPYWAVLDSAIDLHEGFNRTMVIEKAVQLVGEGQRRACEIAWDVLRNHHRHQRKCEAGMAYMMESMPKGKIRIRAREADETRQYFESEGARKEAAAKAME
jgi:hypothetical protein